MPLQYIPKPIKAEATDVTGARALSITYTNNTLRPRLIIVATRHRANAGVGNSCLAQAVQMTPALVGMGQAGIWNTTGNEDEGFTQAFIIPAGGTYRVNTAITGPTTITVTYWIEVNL